MRVRGKDGSAEVEGSPSDTSAAVCEVENKVSAGSVGAGVGGLEDLGQVEQLEIGTVESGRESLSRWTWKKSCVKRRASLLWYGRKEKVWCCEILWCRGIQVTSQSSFFLVWILSEVSPMLALSSVSFLTPLKKKVTIHQQTGSVS